MLGRRHRYRIVAGIDLSEYSDIVLEHALDQAARHDAPELHLLSVRERRKPSAEDVKQAMWDRAYPLLEEFNRHAADWRARLHVRRGRPDEQIAALAAEIAADLIVIGQFGLHTKKRTDKNLPNRVLQGAPCATLVVAMPEAIDAHPQCPVCVATRDDSDGEVWFCEHHRARPRIEHMMTPMTVWTGGSLMW